MALPLRVSIQPIEPHCAVPPANAAASHVAPSSLCPSLSLSATAVATVPLLSRPETLSPVVGRLRRFVVTLSARNVPWIARTRRDGCVSEPTRHTRPRDKVTDFARRTRVHLHVTRTHARSWQPRAAERILLTTHEKRLPSRGGRWV